MHLQTAAGFPRFLHVTGEHKRGETDGPNTTATQLITHTDPAEVAF